jgi:NAD(P)-dependent dehydrogenase (short-subunit alcohol dehydrogenase family)
MKPAAAPKKTGKADGSRRVLVTGASRGIGAAIAAEYRRHGWKVTAPSRSECDLRSPRSVMAWIKDCRIKFDAVVNNAGENHVCLIEDMKLASWEGTLAINLTTPMLLAQAFAGPMRNQRWGRVVNIASIFSHVSRGGRSSYTASKTALVGFTRTAAIEWGPDNVLVNAICPGYIETDLTRTNNSPDQLAALAQALPLRRLGRPEEVARAAFFLGSDENSFITGQSLLIDGGFTAQ